MYHEQDGYYFMSTEQSRAGRPGETEHVISVGLDCAAGIRRLAQFPFPPSEQLFPPDRDGILRRPAP